MDCESDGERITGEVLSRLFSIISRKCESVKISLTLQALSEKLMNELKSAELLNVDKLWIFSGK